MKTVYTIKCAGYPPYAAYVSDNLKTLSKAGSQQEAVAAAILADKGYQVVDLDVPQVPEQEAE